MSYVDLWPVGQHISIRMQLAKSCDFLERQFAFDVAFDDCYQTQQLPERSQCVICASTHLKTMHTKTPPSNINIVCYVLKGKFTQK